MIQDLIPIFIARTSYTFIVGGNSGENEIAISVSMGQDGDSRIAAQASQVDGGMDVLDIGGAAQRNGIPAPLIVRTGDLYAELRTILQAWAFSGIPPKPRDKLAINNQLRVILEQLQKAWDDEGPKEPSQELRSESRDPGKAADKNEPWSPIYARSGDDFTIPLPAGSDLAVRMDPDVQTGNDLLNGEPSLLLLVAGKRIPLNWNQAYNAGYALQRIAEIAYFG